MIKMVAYAPERASALEAIKMVAYAPERTSALEAIKMAVDHGVVAAVVSAAFAKGRLLRAARCHARMREIPSSKGKFL
jgi:N-acetylglucosamine-6-phosphate deacetylase